MARARNGEAISARGRSSSARKKLRRFIRQRAKEKKLDEWRRGRAVLGYIEGRRVVDLAVELDVTRGAVNRPLQWYEALGIEGLLTATPPGASPKLTDEQRKLFLILDNGPCHNLTDEGKAWLGRHTHRIELFRLPAYSPNFNPTEGAWKETKKRTTHNRFFHSTEERDAALVATFDAFEAQPELLAGHVTRFLG